MAIMIVGADNLGLIADNLHKIGMSKIDLVKAVTDLEEDLVLEGVKEQTKIGMAILLPDTQKTK